MSQVLYLVYKHTAPNGKSYIGQTFNYQRRCWEHQRPSKSRAFYNAIQKYGWNNFKHEILKDGLTLEEASFWEEFYIKYFNTIKPNGYNIRAGGNNSRVHEETKIKIGNANRGRIKSEEERKKLATWNGKKHTQEQKDKIGKAHKGKIISKETKLKMKLAAKKRSQDPLWREKVSKTFIQKGHIKSDAHRAAISKAAKERWHKFRENKNV